MGIGRGARCRIRNVVFVENEIPVRQTNRKCELSRAWLFASFDGEFSSRSQAYAGKGGLRASW